MTTITFDTLKFVRRLKDSGIPENQAEAISEAFKDAQAAQIEELASKRDLKELEGQLATKADVAKVDIHVLELKHDLKELELRMTIKLGAMLLAAVGLVVTANRLWPMPVQYVPPPHSFQEMRPTAPVQPQAPVLPPTVSTPPTR
ncbi:MAG: CCDC90 family protein [Magnetococcus sp. DMHC-1]|nr:DUF1640 domain-containing protein [Magnetococcales bacterium]